MVTHQLQVRCRPVKVRRSETNVLPLSHPTNEIVVHNTVQNSSDDLPSYPPVNHHTTTINVINHSTSSNRVPSLFLEETNQQYKKQEKLTVIIWIAYASLLWLTSALGIAAVTGTSRQAAAIACPSLSTLARPICQADAIVWTVLGALRIPAHPTTVTVLRPFDPG